MRAKIYDIIETGDLIVLQEITGGGHTAYRVKIIENGDFPKIIQLTPVGDKNKPSLELQHLTQATRGW